jgi:hypothetical protein
MRVICRVEHAVIDPGALTAASALSQLGKGGGEAGDMAARAISSNVKAMAAIEFGAVQTASVSEDPMQLRRKMASRA